MFTGDIGCQIDRETVGVIESENCLAWDRVAGQVSDGLFQNSHSIIQSAGKLLFFFLQYFFHIGLFGSQLGISVAHHRHQRSHQFVEEDVLHTQLVTMAHSTTYDAAQHITATFVRRNNTVGDQESTGANMIGNHTQGRVAQILLASDRGHIFQQGLKQVDLVVAVHVLQHRRQTLQPGTGIDRRFWQGLHAAVCRALELHEYKVPDFDVAITVFVGTAWGATRHIRAMVIKDFRTGTTGTGITHGPEIVFLAHAGEACRIDLHLIQPDSSRLVIILIDGDPEFFCRQTELFSQQFPGELNCLALEIITEREVAQHFKEGVMTGGVSDVFQIVVLAAGADAALRRGCPRIGSLLITEEDILELHHTRIGEQQCRVIAGYQWATGNDFMAAGGKEIEEFLSDFGALHSYFGSLGELVVCVGWPQNPTAASVCKKAPDYSV